MRVLYYLLGFITLLSLFAFVKSRSKNDLLADGLKGNVKSLKVNFWEIDQNGDTIGTLDITRVHKYNLDGNKTEIINYYDKDSSSYDLLLTKFNAAGKKEKIAYYFNNKMIWQSKLKYDRKGNLKKEPVVYDGYYNSFIKYRYDKKNRLISAKECSGPFFNPYIIKYKYDNDSLIEIRRYNPKSKTIFKYDKKGYLIERTDYFFRYFGGYIPQTKWKYQYDYKGNRIADSTNGNIDIKNIYDIDSNLIQIKEITTYDRIKRNINFTYDKKGNWIKRKEIHFYPWAPHVPVFWNLTVREIKYY